MKILILSLFLITQSALATCNERILQAGGDSRHITIFSSDVYSNGSEMMDEQMALNSANFMNKEFDCQEKLTAANSKITCTDALMQNHMICNIETYYGFYFIYKDYVDTVHVTFSRWD